MNSKVKLFSLMAAGMAMMGNDNMYMDNIIHERENQTHSSLSEDEKAAKKGLNKMNYRGETIYYSSKKSLKKKMSKIDLKLNQDQKI